MKKSELLCCLNGYDVLRRNVLDVCAANRIPKHIGQGRRIVNTDDDSLTGSHWCVIYFNRSSKAEFFDSYGHRPEIYDKNLSQALKQNCSSFVYNSSRLQNDDSNVCGQFCL